MLGVRAENVRNKTYIDYHVGRILFYAMLYGTNLFFYLFLHGYMQLILLAVMTVLPIMSIFEAIWLSKKCETRLTVSDACITRGQEAKAGILLRNPSLGMSLDVRFTVEINNTFYETGSRFSVSIPMVIKGESKVAVPFVLDRNGLVEIAVTEGKIKDIFGLVSVVIPFAFRETIMILPEPMTFAEQEKAGFHTGITENEEDILKGNDLADIGNIREYVPGDAMKDIHWKLSAKKEMLLVKERVRMSESQLVILLELTGSNDQIDEILKVGYNLIQSYMEEGVLVRALWWSEKEGIAKEGMVLNRADLEETFRQVYASGICQKQDLMEAVMKGSRNYMRTFIRVGLQDGAAGAVVVEKET